MIQTHLNLARIAEQARGVAARTRVDVWATIKADAYGLGAARIAEALAPRVAGFCLFALEEALGIDLWRRTGRPAITLGPPSTMDPRPWIEAHVRPAVSTVEQAVALRPARPILCVDTGMQRFACPIDEVNPVLEAGAIDEAFTHATCIDHVTRLTKAVGERGIRLHAAASSLLDEPAAWLNAVRPGLALYRGTLTVTTQLLEVHRSLGPVGYGGWANPEGFHGVIRVGYAAGLRPGPVLINGRRQRMIEVGMQSAYVTADASDRPHDRVVLLGEGITEAEIAQSWSATPHEVLLRMATMRGG